MEPISYIIAVNNHKICRANALASPDLHTNETEIILRCDFPSASLAYNNAIDNAEHDLMVFIHQDVYLPQGWSERLQAIISELEQADTQWGVLGCFGVSLQGDHVGHVYSNGLGRELGRPRDPVLVQALDECVLVMRKSRGLRFDGTLPCFHLYGTDICLTARKQGLTNLAICNFCIHNSVSIGQLPSQYWQCAEFLRMKWNDELPVKTCCITLPGSRIQLLVTRLMVMQRYFRRQQRIFKTARLLDPKLLYAQ